MDKTPVTSVPFVTRPASAKDISISIGENSDLNMAQRLAIGVLREQLYEYGKDLPQPFNTLLVSEAAKGFGIAKRNPERPGRVVFIASPTVTLGCISNGINFEGIVRHEAGHVKYGGHESCDKLRLVLEGFLATEHLEDQRIKSPAQTEEDIARQFGSIRAYEQEARYFKDFLRNAKRIFTENQQILQATPAEFALLMEKNAPPYQKLKRDADGLPPVKVLEAFTKRVQTAALQDPSFKVAWADSWNWNHAEEYACDSYALEHAKYPDSLSAGLVYTNRFQAEKVRLSPDVAMQRSGHTHPALSNRLDRIAYIRKHGNAEGWVERQNDNKGNSNTEMGSQSR